MYKNILVPLDGSTHSQAALDQAIYLARKLEAQLHGVHVIDTRMLRGSFLHDFSGSLGLEPQLHLTGRLESFLEGVAENLLQAFEERCTREGLMYRTSSRVGDIGEALVEAADLQDLVVMGRRGASFDATPQSESGRGIVRYLIRTSPTPVILTGPTWSTINRPVVAYDGSPGSHRALAEAARLASNLNLPLTLCHIREPGTTESSDPLAEAQHYLAPFKLEVRFEARDGGRINTLTDFVDQEQADLLFVGYQGSSRLKELFVGHAPELLLNRIDCPIWVAR